MSVIVAQVSKQSEPPPIDTATAMLNARVEVGFNYAVERVCQNVHHIDHADKDAEQVIWLAIHDVLVRAASDPDVTVTQLLLAFLEVEPEGTLRTMGRR
jgi:hypothetical protein